MGTYQDYLNNLTKDLKQIEDKENKEEYLLLIFYNSGSVVGMHSDDYFEVEVMEALLPSGEILDTKIYAGTPGMIKEVLEKSKLILK